MASRDGLISKMVHYQTTKNDFEKETFERQTEFSKKSQNLKIRLEKANMATLSETNEITESFAKHNSIITLG